MPSRVSVPILIGTICLAVGYVEMSNARERKDKTDSKERRATAWVKRMAASRDSREEFDKWAARGKDTEAGVSAVTDWMYALQAKMSRRPTTLEIVQFVGRYDPIWKDDKYQHERSKELVARVTSLRKDSIKDWNEALDAVNKDAVGEMWTIALMVSLDRMFSADGFKIGESKLLLSRLKALPDDTIEALSKALNVNRAKAAIAVIEEDAFFEEVEVDRKTIDFGLKQLQETVQNN